MLSDEEWGDGVSAAEAAAEQDLSDTEALVKYLRGQYEQALLARKEATAKALSLRVQRRQAKRHGLEIS